MIKRVHGLTPQDRLIQIERIVADLAADLEALGHLEGCKGAFATLWAELENLRDQIPKDIEAGLTP